MARKVGAALAVSYCLVGIYSSDVEFEAQALALDDECLAGEAGEGGCALNAIQRRAWQVRVPTPDPVPVVPVANATDNTTPLAPASAEEGENSTANETSSTSGCVGPWCGVIEEFDNYFDSMDPAVMQEGFDKYTEWPSDQAGIKIAVTKHDFYEMYHGNVKAKLQQYLPAGYFNWDFKKLGKTFTVVKSNGTEATIARHGTITFNLGWWMRSMFWNGCVKALPAGKDFDFSNVTEFDDCTDCPAILEYTVKQGGLQGNENGWKIVDLVLLKLQ
mmetsp:Transcript_10072/g.22266  ORF Transcript_10072/g.22266 Transcript_10072/m.22266 type:complete len:274 (-) Transcript_10072:86-907(-)